MVSFQANLVPPSLLGHRTASEEITTWTRSCAVGVPALQQQTLQSVDIPEALYRTTIWTLLCLALFQKR